MAGIKYLKNTSSLVDLSGDHFTKVTNQKSNTLFVRTAPGGDGRIKYGLTTDTTASIYSPEINLNGTVAYIASQDTTTVTTETVYLTTTRSSTSNTSYLTTTRSSTSDTSYLTTTRASTSNTTYLTRSSTYTSNTSYLTRSSTSSTSYLTTTRSSTSNTSYLTRSSTYTSNTSYLTRSSTSNTSYLTRSSTYTSNTSYLTNTRQSYYYSTETITTWSGGVVACVYWSISTYMSLYETVPIGSTRYITTSSLANSQKLSTGDYSLSYSSTMRSITSTTETVYSYRISSSYYSFSREAAAAWYMKMNHILPGYNTYLLQTIFSGYALNGGTKPSGIIRAGTVASGSTVTKETAYQSQTSSRANRSTFMEIHSFQTQTLNSNYYSYSWADSTSSKSNTYSNTSQLSPHTVVFNRSSVTLALQNNQTTRQSSTFIRTSQGYISLTKGSTGPASFYSYRTKTVNREYTEVGYKRGANYLNSYISTSTRRFEHVGLSTSGTATSFTGTYTASNLYTSASSITNGGEYASTIINSTYIGTTAPASFTMYQNYSSGTFESLIYTTRKSTYTSNTSYLTATRSSTSGTSYLTRSSTSSTSYLTATRSSTSSTSYLTRSSTYTSNTSYLTRSSTYTSDTSYLTRSSTYTTGTIYNTNTTEINNCNI